MPTVYTHLYLLYSRVCIQYVYSVYVCVCVYINTETLYRYVYTPTLGLQFNKRRAAEFNKVRLLENDEQVLERPQSVLFSLDLHLFLSRLSFSF